ncbi:hypothetical protein HIM_05110 [Hirsutella minnesotensis 3608]|uniref:Uncharacterized protein n=1 Tax=Hirsutella minnesotensis 3608 TaxID=1043627 RepID=A0A0F8A5J0_9HYPO|nr:hypothetical protein HIM_05110 [Hirsutella minnesotensis 3608]
MQSAYNTYKELGKEKSRAHIAFRAYKNQNKGYIPEHHLERLRLAVIWGEAAVREAEGRLTFIETYRSAYSCTAEIRAHIQAGTEATLSGRNAVKEARKNLENLWHSHSLAVDPDIFR